MKILALLLLASCSTAFGQALSGLCMLSDEHWPKEGSKLKLMLAQTDCDDRSDHCSGSNNTSTDWNRWTGISPDMLQHEGTALTARMTADAGELTCDGAVHDRVLGGRYTFTPNPAFAKQMESMGFDGITPNKQLGFLMLDVNTAWVKEMKGLGVTELSTDKLMGLRALRVTPEYVRAMSAAGFPELRAGKLTEMKAVGVTPQTAQDAKSMGFNPSEQDLIQMSIFHVDRPFVERMRARGLNDLTLDKLIKIKIFKVDEQ